MTTTAKGVLVVLPVFVSGDDPDACAETCPCRLDSEEDGWICGAFGDQLELVDEDGEPDSATLRSDDCLEAEARFRAFGSKPGEP